MPPEAAPRGVQRAPGGCVSPHLLLLLPGAVVVAAAAGAARNRG